MKFDMHCHTKAGSIDSRIPIEKYIALLKENGFDGMLVTDHDSYKGFRYWQENRDQMPDDFVVLRGVEYDTKDAGHFIVIMPDHIELRVLQIRGMSVSLLEKIVHHFGGVLGPAHPFGARSSSAMFFNKMKKNPKMLRKFDFLEGFNTCETVQANSVARQLADKYNLPCIGGSDSHKEEYVGTGYTIFDRPITTTCDLIQCIKDDGIAAFGGTERKYLRKHKKRNSFAATWGFKAYNRSLGFIYSPYRHLNVRRLSLHRR
ncbi:MAG: PHP domain-containing protein [Emergencia sp.]|nr:PHP domain-containing protein [Emergencia sp.]